MKKLLVFDVSSAPCLSAGLRSGVTAYAVNTPQVGPPSSLWLQLCDGRTLRVGVDMHDLGDWEEIGTLTFEVVSAADTPDMVSLPAVWSDVRLIHKLMHVSDEYEAESGFALTAMNGELLTVLPGADICTLAIQASFYQNTFDPENELADYGSSDFPACGTHDDWPAAAAMNALIDQEHFYYTDCVATKSSCVTGYRIRDDKVEIDDAIVVDESDLTFIFENFSVNIGNATYSGGKAASHGSCGFFCKRTGGLLDWIVMSTESNPFTSVEVHEAAVRFRTSSGYIWTVPNDNIGAIYIEKEELAASNLKRDADSQTTNDPECCPHPVARVENAWQRLARNKNDAIENTFCHELFELSNFDEDLFVSLCDDMDVVLDSHAAPKENYKLLAWIISCTFRCVFSHFDKADSYTITNFDDALSRKWGAEYVDKLRDLLEKTVNAAVE